MNAIIYTRVSTQEQADSGAGLNAQTDACRAFAKLQGWNVVGEYQDAGVSGTAELDKRNGLMTAIGELKKGDVLLVAKRDRMARDIVLTKLIERNVAKKKARIHSLDGNNESTPDGDFMNGILDLSAAREVALIRARTKAALGAKKARGERMGKLPYGFTVADDGVHLVPCASEQSILLRIANLKADGFSIRAIAKALNDDGLFNRIGNPWNNDSIHIICKNIDERLAA